MIQICDDLDQWLDEICRLKKLGKVQTRKWFALRDEVDMKAIDQRCKRSDNWVYVKGPDRLILIAELTKRT